MQLVVFLTLFVATVFGHVSESVSEDREPEQYYNGGARYQHQHYSQPQHYAHQIPSAAIRHTETVGVTKTITPVVTKTTTYNTQSEPAISVGHVHGHSHGAFGVAKVHPVQFNTQYTQYANPTVGVNGPVTYAAHAGGHHAVAVAPSAFYQQAPGYAQQQQFSHQQFVGHQQQQPLVHAQALPVAYQQHQGSVFAAHPGVFSGSFQQPQYAFAGQQQHALIAGQGFVAPQQGVIAGHGQQFAQFSPLVQGHHQGQFSYHQQPQFIQANNAGISYSHAGSHAGAHAHSHQ